MIRNSELAHYGVKGMKWGVRKTYRDKIAPRGKATRQNGTMKARTPTEAQIQALQKQLNYARMSKELGSINKSESRKNVEKLLMVAGTVTISTAASTATSKLVKRVFK